MKNKNLNFFACLENTVAIKAPKQTKQVLKIAKSRMLKVRAPVNILQGNLPFHSIFYR